MQPPYVEFLKNYAIPDDKNELINIMFAILLLSAKSLVRNLLPLCALEVRLSNFWTGPYKICPEHSKRVPPKLRSDFQTQKLVLSIIFCLRRKTLHAGGESLSKEKSSSGECQTSILETKPTSTAFIGRKPSAAWGAQIAAQTPLQLKRSKLLLCLSRSEIAIPTDFAIHASLFQFKSCLYQSGL